MPTAMVTGASSGIGAAFARRLAADGYRLVLVARNRSRLDDDRATLRAAGAPGVEILGADLTDRAARLDVCARLTDDEIPVDLLVNNAGMGLGKDFLAATQRELVDQLELNVTAVMALTHAALPGMVARHRGGVINIASIAGMLPGRGSTYSASKAWVTSFTEGIAMSLQGTGVRMVAVCPGFVRTEFHQRADIDMTGTPGFLYTDVNTVVEQALSALRAGRTVVVPGGLYKALAAAAKMAPRALVRKVAYRYERARRR
ncbi:MAG: short-chain dehydrogenase [Actinobacteria bacterium 69-20]|jgi:short-subunit dehydrogenase|nr:SDR family oxidoreductase [Actinomycetota bacterium]OJV29477.1 MAG: short-chain dehydrogenase [Actinobacteria bacterium 69-20]